MERQDKLLHVREIRQLVRNRKRRLSRIDRVDVQTTLPDGAVLEYMSLFTAGVSQMHPYEPIFGYRLENFPLGTLYMAPAMEEYQGQLNLKNPSSYVFPAENNCAPGDHFKVTQKAEAELFRNYKPFPFKMSSQQRIANWLTVISLMFLACLGVFLAYSSIKRVSTTN